MTKTWTRIEDYKHPVLCRGLGKDPESGLCVMQTAAWLAGEPLSDHPRCASPVLADFSIVVNDGLEDAPRQQMRKLAVPLSGSRADALELQRAEYLIVRVAAELLAPTLRGADGRGVRLAQAASCADIVRELTSPAEWRPARQGARMRARFALNCASRQVLKAAEAFEAARKAGGPPEVSRAVVDAALAGVMLNAAGGKLIAIIEQAIRLAEPPAPATPRRPAAGMTGKRQAATCSAKGTLHAKVPDHRRLSGLPLAAAAPVRLEP